MQPVAEQTVEGEVAVADTQVGAVDVAVEGENERQRVLGDGFGRVGGTRTTVMPAAAAASRSTLL